MFLGLLESLMAGEALSREQAQNLMRGFLDESVPTEQKAAALGALAARRVTGEELVGLVEVMRELAVPLQLPGEVLDTCGTGGGPPTMNMSTGQAFVVAACGVPVAKHGNRAVTSSCGSADVLEELGCRLVSDPRELERVFSQAGVVFLFAPTLHPAMKVMRELRQALKVRTIFNWLGPLSNPARAQVQVIGVWRRDMMQPMAEAAHALGTRRFAIVHAECGLDEVSPNALTHVWRSESATSELVTPDDFGLRSEVNLAAGATLAESAENLRLAIFGLDEARSAALIPGAALALERAGVASDLRHGAELAWDAIRSGQAKAKFEAFREATQS